MTAPPTPATAKNRALTYSSSDESVASVDENVGRLLDYLDESGLAANTIVIYTSDQGFFLGEHFEWRVPIDDENTLSVTWKMTKVPKERQPYVQQSIPTWYGPIVDENGKWIDTHVMNQDFLAWVGQGRIADRTQEHLGASDRGIVAIRRRFSFVKVMPDRDVVARKNNNLATELYDRTCDVFVEHAPEEALNLMPGHSYFLADDENELRTRLRHELIPLLDEYLREGYLGPATTELHAVRDAMEDAAR